ncbi:hypothetical protein ACFE04_031236 [Oxalis oulophora]
MSSSSMLALLSTSVALGNILTYTSDASTSLPCALLTQTLSTVVIPSTMSSSVIPSLSSSSVSVFSLSTFAKAISEAIVFAKRCPNLNSDVKRAEGDKDAKISSLERALARVREFVSLSAEDLEMMWSH